METHVSSTTADVPETQEIVGSHGNVELVVVVEKLNEEELQKAESKSQDNLKHVIQEKKLLGSQSTKKERLPINSPPKKEALLLESVDKQVESGREAQTPSKILPTKQVKIPTPTKSDINTENISPEKQHDSGNSLVKSLIQELSNEVKVDLLTNKINAVVEMSLEVNQEKDLIDKIQGETSNDSQTDMNNEMSDKEHNKSISRELKSLINSAKESKIINECTKLTSKTRKSRAALDSSNTNLNTSTEPESIQAHRRNSSNSLKSNCSEKSDKAVKRSMRSQNPEFVHKVKRFLNSVTGKFQKDVDSDASSASDAEMVDKIKENRTKRTPSTSKNKQPDVDLKMSTKEMEEKSNKLRSDPYCWRCHWPIDLEEDEKPLQPPQGCTVCPRAFHFRCLTGTERTKINAEKNWVCPECLIVVQAECSLSRSLGTEHISLGMLCELLSFAWQRMAEVNGVEPFMQPVDRAVFPDYDKYVVHPMDLAVMKEHIDKRLYGSTEAFLSDAYWILHNSIIFNSLHSRMTSAARGVVRMCRTEVSEVEACFECYAAANARRPTWFTDVCTTPHMLLWAKLKGFPFWPAKAMTVTSAGLVDVRFFGAHDRAWVPARDCFLYSERDPNNCRSKRQDIIDSMQEAKHHIRNITRKYGKFEYAPLRVQFDPQRFEEQLKMMIPSFEGTVRSPFRERRSRTPSLVQKGRSRSKGSKGSKDGTCVGDDASDTEASLMETTTKMEEHSPEREKTHNTRKRLRYDSKEPATSDSCSNIKKRLSSDRKQQDVKKCEVRLVSSSNFVLQEVKEAVDDELDDPMPGPDGELPDQIATGSTSATAASTPKLSKQNSKNNSDKDKDGVALQPDKFISGSEVFKKNEKKKKKSHDSESVSHVKSSKSNKSLNNTALLKVEQNGAESFLTNEVNAAVGNITPSKVFGIEKVQSPECVVLDNITPTTCKGNEKEKSTGAFTANKSTGNDKLMQDKNYTGEKVPGTDLANINTKQEKIPDNDGSNKDEGRNKEEKLGVSPSNKTSGNVKSNETNTNDNNKNNCTKQSLGKATCSDNAMKEKPQEGATVAKSVSIDKSSDSIKPIQIKSITSKDTSSQKASSSKSVKATKDRQRDEESKSAAAGRKATRSGGAAKLTITSVRGLAAAPPAPARGPSAKTRTTQITVEVNPDSSIFTPTSTDNVRNMKEAVTKLQKLRSGIELPPPLPSMPPPPPPQPPQPPKPQVGLVGVRAFARMTSPPEKQAKSNDMLVEVKAEPVDEGDLDTPVRSPTVLESLRPRPTVPVVRKGNLREVRISKVMACPFIGKKALTPIDVRPRAKKTFPQPKKVDDGRSELTSKNSMVYIPIQPPVSQAPVRAALRLAAPGPSTSLSLLRAPTLVPASTNLGITSIAPARLPMGPPPPPPLQLLPPPPPPPPPAPATEPAAPASTPTASSSSAAAASSSSAAVTATVHTVPLITSVNGQWAFSLQPVMSVGVIDGVTTTLANGLGERGPPTVGAAPLLVPAAPNTPLDALPREPPRLQQRPLQSPLAPGAPAAEVPPPSTSGPLTAKLNQNSIKLADFFRTLLEDSLEQLDEPDAQVAALRLQLEQAGWKYQHELEELRHSHALMMMEVRSAMEKEKARAVAETRRLAHQELEAAVKHAKSRQWCAKCNQEAQFYCCWNTAYCGSVCQRAHWPLHHGSCTQRSPGASGADARLPAALARPTPTDVPKTVAAPTVGGKLTTRVVNLEQAQKSPIVVTMMEDTSGNQVIKCVNAGAVPALISPRAHKQLTSNEDSAGKRVVTSGGYLIVGAAQAAVAASAAPTLRAAPSLRVIPNSPAAPAAPVSAAPAAPAASAAPGAPAAHLAE